MGRPPNTKRYDGSMISCGAYVGITGDKKVNPEKIANDLYNSNYNFLTLHLLSPWNNVNRFYPWKFNSSTKKFDVKGGMNPEWVNHFKKICERLAYYYIGLHLKFFDRYFEEKWNTGFHPFVNNNLAGWNWGASAKPLYESWIAGKGFTWLKWEVISENQFKYNFNIPQNEITKILEQYVDTVIAILEETKRNYPGWRVSWAAFNETKAVYENGIPVSSSNPKALGDRPEIQIWIKEKMLAMYDRVKQSTTKFVSKPKGYLDIMLYDEVGLNYDLYKDNYASIKRMGLELELHEIDDLYEIQDLRADLSPFVLFSSDGVKEDDKYFTKMNDIETLISPLAMDYKLWAKYKGNNAWKTSDMQYNWDTFFPINNKKIFGG